ncbi:unnamed protein product [Caenorhabditis nigoni]
MKVPVRSLLALRKTSTTSVAAVEKSPSPILSSEFFDHIRHQVYGDAKKVDKIVVTVKNADEDPRPVLVNRNVSTAFHCFNHLSKQFADDSVLVEVSPSVGGAYFSSVNQPIADQSEIRRIGFDTREHVNLVNEAYWRSCSLVTAAFLREALSGDVDFGFPVDNIQNGYFSVAVKGLDGNVLTPDELNTINRFGKTFIREEKPFETLSLPQSVSEESGIKGDHLVRIGRQVFATNGPVIRSTRQIGRFSIFKSKIGTSDDSEVLVGGVSIPHCQPTSSYSWSLIAKNANQKFSRNQ